MPLNATPPTRHRPHLLALEPRMMFDAAAAVVAQEAIAVSNDAAHPFAERTIDTTPAEAHHPVEDARTPLMPLDPVRPVDAESRPITGAPAAARDVIFIDTQVADYRQLASEWASRGEVVLIDGTGDGVQQMRTALSGQSGIGAIHIVSHGAEGQFWLGTTRVDTVAIRGGLATALGEIGGTLAPGGDILIYGCDFAEGTAGATALAAFADATHADVAASADVTGHAARGGDWTLEARNGTIEARGLDAADWAHTLDPNTPVPIAVTADSLTVTYNNRTVVTGATGYGTDARSPDVGVGAVATWRGAATYQGQSVDLRATVVSISAGDAIRFNRPTGTGANGDDPTFLLRDLAQANDATVQIKWELVLSGTDTALPADVRFTIADIDGIGGNPNTRESVSAATANLAYYTRERVSDINFTSSLSAITASGTQNENPDPSLPVTPQSAATFDWSDVSAFTLTYKLTTNSVTNNAQFYHDGDADFIYTDPVYVSVPRLDLDGDDSTAPGNDAHFTFTENGAGVPIVGADVVVSNPMDVNSITGGTVRLTNWQAGDTFTVGTLPANITATIGAVTGGTQTITLSGLGSESDYAAAFRAITFANTSDTPSTVQRLIDVSFSNDTLTSAIATSRIDVIPVNDPPVAVDDAVTTAEDTTVTFAVLGNDHDPEGDTLSVVAASALHGAVMRNADGTLTYMPAPDYNGADTITYTISDGHGGTATATVAVTVTPVNDAPDAVATLPARSTSDAATVAYATAAAFSDRDGDALSYSATGLPAGLTINTSTGVISGTIGRSASQTGGGSYTVTVTARDPSNLSVTRSFTITVANPAPVAVDDSASTTEDTPVTIAVLGNDSDPDGDPLTVTSASALHGMVTINADGTLRYVPSANYNGSDTITYAISDGQGGTSTARVAVTITPANDAPTPVGTLPARNTTDAATVSYPTAGGFTDVDGDTLRYAATGLPAGLTIDSVTGVISGTVDRSASQPNAGRYAVVVTARDSAGASATQTFALTVANPAPTATNDSASTREDTPVTIAVLGNDRDPDGDPLTVTSASALHGTVAINADGTLRYTPDLNYNGADTISYAIGDGQGGTSAATVAVTITPGNDAPTPVGTLPARATTDAATVSYPTAGAFGDVDGDALTYLATGLPAGLAIDAGTGVISGMVDRSASQPNGGRYTVVVTARDPSNATTTQSFTLTVSNPAPTAVNDSASTTEDTPISIAVLGNDSDPDGDPLTVTTASALHGSVMINPNGTLGYTPNANYNGADTISYTISDGQGGTSSATAAVTIAPANDAPSPVGTLPDRATSDAATVFYPTAGGFSDVDGDTLTYSATGLPAGLTIDAATGVISGTLGRSASIANGGSYAVVVTARDSSNTTVAQRFAITVANPAPIAIDDRATTTEDTPVTIAVLGNDSDPDGDPLTVKTASALHGTVMINPDNTLRYTPDANYNGSDTITYRIIDGDGGTSIATVSVTITPVDDAPTAVGTLPPRDGLDGAAVSYPTAGGFADVDGDALTYSATGLPAGLSIDPVTGIISGTLDRSASQSNNGTYAIVVTARDTAGASATQGFTLSVANPAPIARNDAAATTEDASVTVAVLGNDSDPDGDTLSVTSASALHGIVAINPDGTLRYTPNANYNGSDTITYTISDGQGGSSTAAVAVTVAPVDDAPTAVGTLTGRTSTDAATVSYPTAGGFADIDGDALTYSASGLPSGLTIDPATGVISGTIDRSASVPNGGSYVVTVTATDPSGAFVRQNFPIDVANPAPTARDDTVRTHVDTAVTVPVLANDSDPDGDPLTVTSATADTGTVAINADGSLLYTPAAGFAGRAAVTYAISDGQGGSGAATLTIDVTNAAPTVAPVPPVTASDGQPVDLPLGARFSDADGDTLTFTATGLPPGLTIDPVTGRVTGTLFRSASQVNGGVYDATVTASDGHGGTVSTIVRFTIGNPAPVARDEAVTTPEDTPITIAVLANDNDPDGDPVSVIFATTANGRVSINPDGTITYRPNPDFTGVDQIRYTISDGQGGTAMATGTVTVTPVNDAPTTTGIPDRITADGVTVEKPVAPSFGDPDGDPLTYTVTGLPPGLTIDPRTGIISGTIRPGSANGGPAGDGVYRAIVTATDPSGATVSAPFVWTVSQTAPNATDDSATTREDTPVTIPVLANDSDADNDPLTIVGAVGTHGTAIVVGDAIRFIPDPDFTGVATVVYTVSDPAGNRATATVTITVTPVNDAPVATGTPSTPPARDGQAITLDVGGFFRDPDGDPLRYGASGLPAGLSIDPATGRITGTIARDASRAGVYRVTITATDPSGATTSSSFDWTIANPAPIARDDTATTPEDTATIIPVLGNDSDPDGDPLTVVAATAPNGTVTINPDGTLGYTPNANFTGNDVISYTIDDGNGGRATASVLVSVTPVNDAPIVVGPAPTPVATQDGARLTLPTGGWFVDPDGDTLTYSATGLPDGLSIDPRTGIISGIVDRAASGTNGGVYPVLVTVRDANGGNTGTTVELRVTNPAPIATDDTARTTQDGGGVTIPVLANDRDPDGDPLTLLTATAINGTTTINPDGSLRYVPGPGFSGTDFIRYTISDGQGGTAFAFVTVTVDPLNRTPIVAGREPVSVPGGLPVSIDVLTGSRDPDGDPISVTGATVATGTVRVNPDGTLTYAPPLGFTGTTTIGYTISDGRGGVSTGTILVRVTPGAAADVEQLLRIGRVTFQDPTPALATVVTRDGVVRNPLSLLGTVDGIRSLRGTSIGDQPVGDAVEAIRSLRGTSIDPDSPITAEVVRLDALREQRDAGDRLFDQRWSDFMVKGLTGFSAADDRHACIMVESVVRGGAIYLEVRDTAREGARAAVRSVDVRLANGKHADWIKVDHRGLAIIERAADMDELHLVVRVTRTDGTVSSTPILVQGQTGEIKLDRKLTTSRHAAPLDMTLQTPNAAIQAEATRLAGLFQ